MKYITFGFALWVAGIAAPAVATAQVPGAVGLQGFIHTQGGQPYEGDANLEVRVYSTAVGGTPIATESLSTVPVVGSRFSVEVGPAMTFTDGVTSVAELFESHTDVWVALAVNGNAELPRQRFVSGTFAFRANHAAVAADLACTGCVDGPSVAAGALEASHLGQVCGGGELLKFGAGTNQWGCAPDADSAAGGFVSSLGGGAGVQVSASTGSVTVSLDGPAAGELGGVTDQTCSSGAFVTGYSGSGAPVCQSETTYTAGGGLSLSGGAFSIANNGVTSARIADGAVANADVSASAAIAATKIANTAAVLNFTNTQAFGGDALVIDGGADEVGINVSNPSATLDVGGDVRASGDFRYSSNRTYYHFISAYDFGILNQDDAAWELDDEGYGYFDSGVAILGVIGLRSDVRLPDGAVINELRCYTYDNTSSGGLLPSTFNLRERSYGSATDSTMATVTINSSSNSGSVASTADSTVSSSTVDNGSKAYFIAGTFHVSNSDTQSLRFYGCRLRYQLGEVSSP